jgi:hypothetical protein
MGSPSTEEDPAKGDFAKLNKPLLDKNTFDAFES